MNHHSKNYAAEDAAATQMHFPYYQSEQGQGCCVSSDNPNYGYWLRNAARGKKCPTLSMSMEQCCGPAGEMCVHGRNAEYDKVHGYNLWFPRK